MLVHFSQQLLGVLQLARMALVFTAVSNSLTTLLMMARRDLGPGIPVLPHLRWDMFLTIAIVSIGLYGFGMSLNDIVDRRRDQQIASHRPLPSGRIDVITAHVVCVLLALIAIIAGATYWAIGGRWQSFALLMVTGFLITLYDLAGKYLVGPGLLTLGLVRACHALIPAGGVVVLWHPLLLLNYITIVSAVAYVWEQKRPRLTRPHWLIVIGGLGFIDIVALFIAWWHDRYRGGAILWSAKGLAMPLSTVLVFAIIGWVIHRRSGNLRQAGSRLMLFGLLWLIVLDASFAAAYVGFWYAGVVFLLVPVSYLMVQIMRWWASIVLLSQPPTYKRAGVEQE